MTITNDIAITGAGYSGLTLALRLQQLGLDPILYTAADPATMRLERLPNTVGRFPHTLAREAALGVTDPVGAADIGRIEAAVGPPLGLAYAGRLTRPLRATDFRVLLPDMLELYFGRGGRLVIAPELGRDLIGSIVGRHRITVVTSGRASIDGLFPRNPARSPYQQPQRLVLAGLFDGLAPPEGAVCLNLIPGVGEVVQMPIVTSWGAGTSILVNAVPDGPLAPIVSEDPDVGFPARLAALLEVHAPAVAERVDRTRFALAGDRHWVRAAVVPTVRRAWCELAGGRLALAVGDAWIVNDPITGQGANLGSRSAWVAADHIAGLVGDVGGDGVDGRRRRPDAAFGRRVEEAMWHYAEPVTSLTNAFLQPPPPHVVALQQAAAEHQAVADHYVDLFDDPPTMWNVLASPLAVDAFVQRARGEAGPAPVAAARPAA